MRSTGRAAIVAAAGLGAVLLGTPGNAVAKETAGTAVVVGYDVSHPQCDVALPADAAFAVIGVNGGIATTVNPCLAEQWEWGQGAAGAVPAELYLNTANPGELREQVSTWPERGGNRYGACAGDNSAACSYEYGRARAADDVLMVLDALGEAGISDVTDLAGMRWWLDVETMNTWQTGGEEAQHNNRAALEGMAEQLTSVGGQVGLYSTGQQWNEIVGAVLPWSSLYGLDSWLAGAESRTAAVLGCSDEPLVAGGRVVLTQYVLDDLDHDHLCAPESDGDAAPR